MNKKSFILSSAGLKNLVQNQSYGDNFTFIFGEHEIQMENLFAEFISPYVSQIHQSDPTITSIHFYNKNCTNKSKTNYVAKMSEEVFSLFESVSKGNSIDIDEELCFQLQIISVLLKNKEMFRKLEELFGEEKEDESFEKKVSEKLDFVSFLEMNSDSSEMWDQSKTIEYIASKLYSIEEEQIIDLSRTVFYSILKNAKLTVESEDWLLGLIDKFMIKKEEEDREKEEGECEFAVSGGLSDVYFYEEVNFDFLSEDRLKEFIGRLDPSEMTVPLWDKIKKCFYFSMRESRQASSKPPTKREGNGFYRHIQRYAENIVVGGYDEYRQIGENPTKKNGSTVIHPPQNLQLDPSSLLSYSAYYMHSASVTRSGSLIGVGCNSDGRISSSLAKTVISQFSEFSMKDSSGRPLAPVSAVCTECGTLYMLTKSCGSGRQLVFCDSGINSGTPVFLDIGNKEPVSLFGGYSHAAAICADGEVIFVNRDSVRNSPSSRIDAVSLPGSEKATMVACLDSSVFVLSWSGRVFASGVESGSCALKFSAVSELSDKRIVWLSGSYTHCLAVSSEGRVFGRGSNGNGELGVGKGRSDVPSFTEISSLSGHKIRAAYAGCYHSLFETCEGRVLACGCNSYGQLLLRGDPSNENVYSPAETTITGDATFCVAGELMSAVFIGGDPPPNTPNMPVRYRH